VHGSAKKPFETINQFHADLVSVCAHKFHGPKGAGLLYIKSPLHPDPILFGGGHENERRAGTEIFRPSSHVEALEKFVKPPVFDRVKFSHSQTNSFPHHENRRLVNSSVGQSFMANTVAFTVRGSDGSR